MNIYFFIFITYIKKILLFFSSGSPVQPFLKRLQCTYSRRSRCLRACDLLVKVIYFLEEVLYLLSQSSILFNQIWGIICFGNWSSCSFWCPDLPFDPCLQSALIIICNRKIQHFLQVISLYLLVSQLGGLFGLLVAL